MKPDIALVIAAGGIGSRFSRGLTSREKDGARSKLFFMLAGKTVLQHSVEAFDTVEEIREIILAVPREACQEMRRLTRGWSRHPLKITAGGKTRAESVWNGIRKSSPACKRIMVHDAARPLIDPASVRKLIRSMKTADCALLASPIAATVKQADSRSGRVETTLDRSRLFAAETPQLAARQALIRAYRDKKKAFLSTDEAGLLEADGARVKIVTHDSWNPKITTYKDLKLAEAYIGGQAQACVKAGLGQDLHRLVKGRKLYLGGLHIPYAYGALGHSDGDVVLHSVMDAVLGVMGAGDIGDWFSDKDKRFKNIRSTLLLEEVMKAAQKSGWQITHADVVITLERPKLAGYKLKIKKNLARLLGTAPENISIKAKTAEGLGPEGQGEALSCQALVTMKKEKS